MSVRIYQLSKQLNIDNNELIQLLQDRGYEVKSASSTIDNISAESLIEEFAKKNKEAEAGTKQASDDGGTAEKKTEATKPKGPAIPSGAFVKSREEVEKEREARKQAEAETKKAAQQPAKPAQPKAPPTPPPAPEGKRPPATPPPVPASGSKAPPAVPPRPASPGNRPAPMAPPRNVPPAAVIPPREGSSKSPATPPPVAPPRPAAAESAGEGVKRPSTPPPVAPPTNRPPATPPAIPGKEKPTAEAAPEADAPKQVIVVKPPIVVRDFAVMINLKPFKLISELMEMGIFASMNQAIDEEVAVRVAKRHNIELDIRHRGEGQQEKKQNQPKPAKVEVDESKFLEPRPPIVCILGHVDHGKTTLLDTIRKANVVSGEAGGITQHIGAYQIEHDGKKISFIDTPGHAAFSKMRARGAHVTDVAILVVAADDGFMPQTDEALGHARAAGVPVIVAINKVDARGANIERVKQQMQERNLAPEEWGGETICVPVSALKGEGIDQLLEMILLQAEIMELKANPKCDAEGIVIETQKETGQGSTATVIVQKGTLKIGDALVSGPYYCRVRALVNDRGERLKSARPGTPVKVIGWSGPPESGSTIKTVKNEREAKKEAEANEIEIKRAIERSGQSVGESVGGLDALFAAIEQTQKKIFRVVVKSDVYGTAEAVASSLEEIESEKIELEIVQIGVGPVSKNDVIMASASNAVIVGFNVGVENGVTPIAKHHGVRLYFHDIIYVLIDQIREAMADELPPELRESKLGAAEVRQVFPLGKSQIAGCLVTEGKVVREGLCRVLRKGKVISEGRINALKRFKDDATEVRAGYECGIRTTDFSAFEEGDVIECYEIQKIRAAL